MNENDLDIKIETLRNSTRTNYLDLMKDYEPGDIYELHREVCADLTTSERLTIEQGAKLLYLGIENNKPVFLYGERRVSFAAFVPRKLRANWTAEMTKDLEFYYR